MSAMEDLSLKGGCGTVKSVVLWGTGAIDDGMSGYLIEGAFFPSVVCLGLPYRSNNLLDGLRAHARHGG